MKINFSYEIRKSVTAREVFEHYGFEINRAGFCRSPFAANDKTPSLKVYDGDRGWHDFSSGKGGDIIDFVREYFNLSFPDAQKKLNDDLHLGLPIGERLTADKLREAERAARERQQQVQERKAERERLKRAYNRALDWWVYLDRLRQENAPRRNGGGFCADYAYALRKLPEAEYRLSCAEIAQYKFDHPDENT